MPELMLPVLKTSLPGLFVSMALKTCRTQRLRNEGAAVASVLLNFSGLQLCAAAAANVAEDGELLVVLS